MSADEEEDEQMWTLASLDEGVPDDGTKPSREDVLRLIVDMRNVWIAPDSQDQEHTVEDIVQHVMNTLNIHVFTWSEFQEKYDAAKFRFTTLHKFVSMHGIDGDPLRDMHEIANSIFTVRELMKLSARMVANTHPTSTFTRRALPPDFSLEDENENVFEHREKDNTAFQNLFFHLRLQLEGYNYKKAGDHFFSRLVLGNGTETMAFEEAIKIKDFIMKHSDYYTDYKAYKWSTAVPSNVDLMTKHLKERPLLEAPLLEENNHLRSYGSVEDGKGLCGVYDNNLDMFWPYNMRSEWHSMACDVQMARRKMGMTKYRCYPPDPTHTCVIHLDASFCHDIYEEVMQVTRPRGEHWVRTAVFSPPEQANMLVQHLLGQGVFDAGGMHVMDRKSMLKYAPSIDADDFKGKLVGSEETGFFVEQSTLPNRYEWHRFHFVEDVPADLRTECEKNLPCVNVLPDGDMHNCIVRVLTNAGELLYYREQLQVDLRKRWVEVEEYECRHREFFPESEVTVPGLGEKVKELADGAYATHGKQDVFPKPRAVFTEEEWTFGEVDLTFRSFVKVGERYFRVHVGARWDDCPTVHIDHIYKCQKCVKHDLYMLHAIMGRLFYEVKEKDGFEGTVMLEGIGGCGKSTIVTVYQMFWPAHLIATLSSNIEPRFGMSQLAHGRVAWCTEMNDTPGFKQEEWQDGCSGAALSLAVKGEPTMKIPKWKIPFFWCGNSFPTSYKNFNCQVSRRIYGILMAYPVTPRQDNIVERIRPDLAFVQRRANLAYFDWLEQQGRYDPMSRVHLLPPAFRSYYERTRRDTDPIMQLLSDPEFVEVTCHPDDVMPAKKFKEIYVNFRQYHDMGRLTKWNESVYRSSCLEKGIVVRSRTDDSDPNSFPTTYMGEVYEHGFWLFGIKDAKFQPPPPPPQTAT